MIIIQSYNFSLPEYFNNSIQIFQILSNAFMSFFSMECVIIQIFGDYSMFYKCAINFFTFFLLFMVLYIYYIFFGQKKFNYNFRLRIMTLLFITQPIYLYFFYSSLICIKINDKSYLKNQTEIECFNERYFSWLFLFFLPNLIFFAIIVPIILIKFFSNQHMKKKFDYFLTIGYSSRTLKWELLNYIFKLMLIITNETNFNDEHKAFIIQLIFFYYLFLQLTFRPYKIKFYKFIDILMKLSLIFTVYSIIWLNSEISNSGKLILFVLTLGIHLSFVLYLIKSYFIKSSKIGSNLSIESKINN